MSAAMSTTMLRVFFMLVFMAVFTTYMTAPILRRLIPGSEVWSSYRLSDSAARIETSSPV